MAPEDHTRDPETPDVNSRDVEDFTDAELEALEDAEDLRIARERRNEETVSWESIKAKYGWR